MRGSWLVFGLPLFVGCHGKPNRMPKGFENLRLGISTAAALDSLLADGRWHDHVRLKIDGGTVEKRLGYAKDRKSALSALAQGADELRAQVKGTSADSFSPSPVISVESAEPFRSFDLKFENDVVSSVMFYAAYSDQTYNDFLTQAKAKFGSKCEPYDANNGCHLKSCEWDFCDEHVAYEVEAAECSDNSSAVTVEIKQHDCPTEDSAAKPKL